MRTPSEVDKLANTFVDDLLKLEPELAIDLGVPFFANTISDFSYEGAAAHADLNRRVLQALQATKDEDEIDSVTRSALTWDLQNQLEMFEAGLKVGELNNIASPVQVIRNAFPLMPMLTAEDWKSLIRRVSEVPSALETYISGLQYAIEQGRVPSRTQVGFLLTDIGAQDPYGRILDDFGACAVAGDTQLLNQLENAVKAARTASADFATWLRTQVAPIASNRDAVGEDEYVLLSAHFLGAKIDPRETYDWALNELRDIHSQQMDIVRELYGTGVTVAEAFDRLNADPSHQVIGVDGLQRWMQATSDEAVEYLADRHFTVTDEMRKLAAKISPNGDGGIFYTAPTEDNSRPGTMWWAVPPGVEVFHTWQEKTTVYHEGMPGHHMQLGRAVFSKDSLNTWRRQLCWFSGHGEGWALYAEQLMDELGFLSHPAERLGMLDAQRLRAARVLVDIGVHVKLPKPSTQYLADIGISHKMYQDALAKSPYLDLGAPDGSDLAWNRNDVWAFMSSNVAMDPKFLEFETTRYLGWPGQASSYKVGQRVWEQLRKDWMRSATRAKNTDDASLRAFHDRALELGGLPLEVLKSVMRGE